MEEIGLKVTPEVEDILNRTVFIYEEGNAKQMLELYNNILRPLGDAYRKAKNQIQPGDLVRVKDSAPIVRYMIWNNVSNGLPEYFEKATPEECKVIRPLFKRKEL